MSFQSHRLFAILFVVLFAAKEVELFKLPTAVKDNDDDVNLKIINGEFADENQFPYQVYVQTSTGGGMAAACGGVLVSDTHIVTAAHCVYQNGGQADPSQVQVFVGVDNISQLRQDQIYQAANVYTHPDYTNQPPYHSDIAVIELQSPIQFEEGVEKACLNYQNKQYDYLIASGFGVTSRPKMDSAGNPVNNPDSSDQLKYATFQEDPSQGDDCQDIFICIRAEDPSDSTCEGDSGGPLSTPPDSEGKMQVIGVTSNGSSKPIGGGLLETCLGDTKYTRLATFSDFIDEHVGAENYCAVRN